jgi:cytochrome c oxidase subunit 4
MNSLKFNLRITAALLGLLLATVASAYVDLGPLNTAVSMLISLTKAALIVFFFMQVRREEAVTRLAAAAGVFWLAIMFVLTLSDYLTRAV